MYQYNNYQPISEQNFNSINNSLTTSPNISSLSDSSVYNYQCQNYQYNQVTNIDQFYGYNQANSYNYNYNYHSSPVSSLNNYYSNINYPYYKNSEFSHNSYSDSENTSDFNQPDLIQQVVQPTFHSSNQSSISDQAKNNANKNSRKHQLPDEAVDIMNEWFEDHVNNPYPSLEEKEKLAKKGGISIKQVSAWFSNRRNRSQNTKPKRIKRVLEKEMTEIFQELVYNSNKSEVIEKFRQTIIGTSSLNV